MARLFTRKNIIIGVLVIGLVVAILSYYAYQSVRKTIAQTKRVDESLVALRALEAVMDDMQDIETGLRGYAISHDTLFLSPLIMGFDKLSEDSISIRNLQVADPVRRIQYDSLLNLILNKSYGATEIISLVKARQFENALELISRGSGRHQMDSVRAVISRLETAYREVLTSSNISRKNNARSSIKLLVIISLITIAGLIWLVWRLLHEEKNRKIYESRIEYLARLSEQSSDAIYSTDKQGIIQSWNKGAELVFGYTREEVLGKFAPSVTGSGRTLKDIERISASFPDTGTIVQESVVFDKTGKEKYCLGSVTELRNENDILTGFVIILRDISDRKQNEQLLRRFNEKLEEQVRHQTETIRSIVERIKDGFFSINNKHEITFVNDYAASLMGGGSASLIGQSLWKVFPEEMKSSLHSVVERTTQLQEPGELTLFFEPHQSWFSFNVYSSGTGLSIYFRDITEQRNTAEALQRTNERFDLINRTTRDAIWEWDLLTNELWGNDMHQRLYGLKPDDPVPPEKEWLERIHPEDRDRMMERQKNALQSESNVFISEYRFRTEFENYREIYDRCYIVRDEQGKAIRLLGSMMDVTERKLADAKIRESEELYRAVVKHAVEALVVLDANTGKFLNVSLSAEALFKLSREELTQVGPIELSPEFQPDGTRSSVAARNKIERAIAGEKLTFEWMHQDHNGVPMFCEVTLVRLPALKEVLIRGTIVNITERKKAETALKESEEIRGLIMNAAMDAIVCFDMEGLVTVWTPQAEEVFGWSQPEALDQPLSELVFPVRFREAFAKGLRELHEDGNRPLLQAHTEFTAVAKGKKEFPVEISVVLLRKAKNPFYCAFIRDITARKQAEQNLKESEEKIRQILSSSADDFYVIDRNYRVTLINATAQNNLWQLWNKKVTAGTYILDIFPEERKNFIRENYEKVFRGERVEYEFTIVIEGKNNWRRVSYSPVRDADGNITGGFIGTTDITDKKRAEEDILKTNARFQILSKATSDIIWDLNLEDNKLWWNDNYYSTLGYRKKGELVDLQDWFDQIHPEDLERVKGNFYQAIRGSASSWRDEYRYRKADNTYLNVLDRGYIIRNEDSTPLRMIGSMVDMTRIYQVQKKVLESENRLRTILDTDPECIKLLDAGCKLIDINKAGLQMIEADRAEDIIGHDLLTVVSGNQKSEVAQMVKDAAAGVEGRIEFEMVTLRGRRRWCEVSFVPFRDAEGSIICVLGVTRDMTDWKLALAELERNEEKYRTLVEQAGDAISLYDATGKILDVNSGAVELLGYSKKELMKMYLKDVLTPEEINQNPVRYDILRKGESTVKQRKMRKKDGSIVETEVRSQQLPDGRFLSVIRDLSERIKAEQELQHYYNQLKELNSYLQNVREEERSNIAREIHDELGQQLTVLKMDISWLRKKVDASKPEIRERMEGLIEMVDNTVKSVRRISSELRPSLLDDLGLPAAIEWHAQEFSKRTGIDIQTDIEQLEMQLPGKISITLFRVYQESLTNVARHAKATTINVCLKKEDQHLFLAIRDNGKGFLQTDIESRRTLGILGMKERIAIINGKYLIESEPGKGTLVRVTVPVPLA